LKSAPQLRHGLLARVIFQKGAGGGASAPTGGRERGLGAGLALTPL